jgi:hypothetical protein
MINQPSKSGLSSAGSERSEIDQKGSLDTPDWNYELENQPNKIGFRVFRYERDGM